MNDFDDKRNAPERGKINTKVFYPKAYPILPTITYGPNDRDTYLENTIIFLLPELPYHKLFIHIGDAATADCYGEASFFLNNTIVATFPWKNTGLDNGRYGLPHNNAFGGDTMSFETDTFLVPSFRVFAIADEFKLKIHSIAAGEAIRLGPLIVSSVVPW